MSERGQLLDDLGVFDIDCRKVGWVVEATVFPGHQLRALSFVDVAEAVNQGSGVDDSGEYIWTACPFANVGEVHNSFGRSVSHNTIGPILNIELMTSIRVVLEAPCAQSGRERTGKDSQHGCILEREVVGSLVQEDNTCTSCVIK